ncbi:MAG TPA: ACT domain-containing protein [Candidatus Limnocylindria bacterium]|nr:ACT domain-containing protein [Candidatus Limnocylindria bacterium]
MAGQLKELRVSMEDKPGALAKLTDALAKASVNIEAISAATSGGSGDIRILVEDTAAARKALEGAGIKVAGEREMLFVDLEDRPGSLAATAKKLADQGINVDAIYVVGAAGGKKQIAVGTADVAKARTAVR